VDPDRVPFLLPAGALLLGASLGSFLNVVVARVPEGLSVVHPRSRCPRCLAPIAWYDNLPVLSWVLLRARCRACRLPISARYPLVELAVAAAALLALRRHGPSGRAGAELLFVAFLLGLALIDLDTWLLPDAITKPVLAGSIVLSALGATPAGNLATALQGAGLGFMVFAAIAWVGERAFKREAMGFGDVWLVAGLGAFLGVKALLPVVLFASLQGSLVGGALLLGGKLPKGREGEARGDAAGPAGDGAATATPTATPAPTPAPTATSPPTSTPGPYLSELVAQARQKRLGEDRWWLRLGHWRKGLLGGWEAEPDGAGFFLSPRGKSAPQAELEATLAGFFGPEEQDPEVQHPQCKFPARLAFAVKRLGFEPSRLPRRACPKLAEWWDRTRAQSVTLVFSSYYMNNPASAFGHTFLRLDRRLFAGPGERLELIDQGIDYAANPDTGNAVLYAVKGLVGLFPGTFSARPYFYKVREYADFESRDLWEYQLSLPPEAVAILVAHLWELGSTWFQYFYLTENCSYHVLGALEAADPGLDLLEHVGKVVIPADTVKALFRNPGLVEEVRYRPSARTTLEQRVAPLDETQRAAMLELARAPTSPVPPGLAPGAQVQVLDAALDLVDVRLGREIIRGELAATSLRQSLLERRSAIPVASPPLDVPRPRGGGPERGHDSTRLGLGGGASRQAGPFALLDWRLALHDLADPPAGFSAATQLEFLRTRARWEARGAGGKLRLDEALLVSGSAMTPLDRLDPRISFRMRAGAERIRDGGCPSCLAGTFLAGGGTTLAAGPLALMLTGDGWLQYAPDLHGLRGSGFRPALGPGATLRLVLGDRVAFLASGTWRWQPEARPDTAWDLSAQARLHLGPVSLYAEGRKTQTDAEVMGGVQLFY